MKGTPTKEYVIDLILTVPVALAIGELLNVAYLWAQRGDEKQMAFHGIAVLAGPLLLVCRRRITMAVILLCLVGIVSLGTAHVVLEHVIEMRTLGTTSELYQGWLPGGTGWYAFMGALVYTAYFLDLFRRRNAVLPPVV